MDQKHRCFPSRFVDLRFADWDICGNLWIWDLRIWDLRIWALRIWDLRINHYKFYWLAICGLAHLRNLQICDCGMSPRIFGFAICGLTRKFACPPLVTSYLILTRQCKHGPTQPYVAWTSSQTIHLHYKISPSLATTPKLEIQGSLHPPQLPPPFPLQ
jgi:hypothetical protein